MRPGPSLLYVVCRKVLIPDKGGVRARQDRDRASGNTAESWGREMHTCRLVGRVAGGDWVWDMPGAPGHGLSFTHRSACSVAIAVRQACVPACVRAYVRAFLTRISARRWCETKRG